MNNLALALLQGGVYHNPKEPVDDTTTAAKSSLPKGLFFRQFMPTSSAVYKPINIFHIIKY